MSAKDELIKALGKSLTMWDALKLIRMLEGRRMGDVFLFWRDPNNYVVRRDMVEFDGVGFTTLARQFSDRNIKVLRETPALIDSLVKAILFMKDVYGELLAFRKERRLVSSRLPVGDFMQTKFWDAMRNDSVVIKNLLKIEERRCKRTILNEDDELVEVPVPDFNPYKIDGSPINFTIQARRNVTTIKSSNLYANAYCREDFICSAFNGLTAYPLDMWEALEEMSDVEKPKSQFPRYLEFLRGKKMKFHISLSMEFVKKYVQEDNVWMTNLAKSLINRYMKFDSRFFKLPVENEVDLKSVKIRDIEYGKSLASSYYPEDCDNKNAKYPTVDTISFGCDFDCSLQLKEPIDPSESLDKYACEMKLPHGSKEFFQCMRDVLEHPGKIQVKSKKAILKTCLPSKEDLALRKFFSKNWNVKSVAELYYLYGDSQAKEAVKMIYEARDEASYGTLIYKHLILYRMCRSMAMEGLDDDMDRCIKQLGSMKTAVEGMVAAMDHLEKWAKENSEDSKTKKRSLIQDLAMLIDARVSLDPLMYIDCAEFPCVSNYAKKLIV